MNGPTLVTGAGGFLGGHVVAALAARGEAVRALDIAFPAALPAGVERIDGSILDQAALAGAMAGAGAVIHCAAIADLWEPPRWAYDRVNMRGACEVLIAARRARARRVLVSSSVPLVGGRDLGEASRGEARGRDARGRGGPSPRPRPPGGPTLPPRRTSASPRPASRSTRSRTGRRGA